MVTAPLWWFVVSGVCFIISIVLNLALIAGGVAAWTKLSPALEELRGQVRRLGEKTSDIASTARSTVETVHDRTEKILGTAQEASAIATHRIGAASAALTVVFVAARTAAFLRSLRGHGRVHRKVAA